MGVFPMERDSSIEPFGFKIYVIGLKRRPTNANNFVVTYLQRIMTLQFVTLDMLDLVVPYLFAFWFVLKNDDCLGRKLSEMIDFMLIMMYKRYDMIFLNIPNFLLILFKNCLLDFTQLYFYKHL